MDKKSILTKIRELFSQEVLMEEDYKNEINTKLEDGTEVKVMSKGEALSVGDEVLVKDAEGNFVKAPEGKHMLEGGMVIYTDAEGFINELETKETEMEDTDVEEQFEDMVEDVVEEKGTTNEIMDTTTDGVEIKIVKSGEEVSVGDEVMIRENEDYVKARSGKYDTTGGLSFFVSDNGVIVEMGESNQSITEVGNEEYFQAIDELSLIVKELKDKIELLESNTKSINEKFEKYDEKPSVKSVLKDKDFNKFATVEDKLKFYGQK